MVVQMIAVGESTGAMDTMLQKIADFYEDEVEVAVEGFTKLLEPHDGFHWRHCRDDTDRNDFPIFSVAGCQELTD